MDGAPSAEDLRRDYGLDVKRFTPHEGGFESDCWVVDDRWFVKVFRYEAPARLAVLQQLEARGVPVVVPLTTTSGELTATTDGRAYAVFPFVRGRTATDDDWAETARLLRRIHEVSDVDLPRTTMDEWSVEVLPDRLDHPWICDRAAEVMAAVERLEAVIERARSTEVPHVVCHRDFGGWNLLLDDAGRAVAILDWDHAQLAPPEHDVWIAAEGPHLTRMLDTYGARDLDPTHLEYALLARGVGDLAVRVYNEVDRPGVDTWGFDRIARLDDDLAKFRHYCR